MDPLVNLMCSMRIARNSTSGGIPLTAANVIQFPTDDLQLWWQLYVGENASIQVPFLHFPHNSPFRLNSLQKLLFNLSSSWGRLIYREGDLAHTELKTHLPYTVCFLLPSTSENDMQYPLSKDTVQFLQWHWKMFRLLSMQLHCFVLLENPNPGGQPLTSTLTFLTTRRASLTWMRTVRFGVFLLAFTIRPSSV